MDRPAQDREIFGALTKRLAQRKISEQSAGRLVVEVGKSFLGAPYQAGLLETRGTEHLVVNLRAFDCVTFVESVIALAWCMESGQESFKAFRKFLQRIRYRKGRLQGFPSRLHYFSDWIRDNHKKGLVREVTAEIGGRPWKKTLAFMTTHPDLYPPLQKAATLRRMKAIERAISRRSLSLIPKKSLRRLEGRLHDGDLIAIATNTERLDVQHVGFAARVGNRIHLLHASSQEGKVVLTKETLYRYLMKSRTCSGVMIVNVLAKSTGQKA